jgi:hypothetical protein
MSCSKIALPVVALATGAKADSAATPSGATAPAVGKVVRILSVHDPLRTPAPTVARIHQRGRSPLQSGRARESIWLLTFEPRQRPAIDNLMGWTSSRDTLQQVELRFPTLEQAVAFAQRRGLYYLVETPRQRATQPKSYADNFRRDRRIPWTH